MPTSAIPIVILAVAGFGSFGLVLGFVSVWAHAKDSQAKVSTVK